MTTTHPSNPKNITQELLKTIFNYCPDSGFFSIKMATRMSPVGRRIGMLDKDGYIRIKYQGRKHYAHRLAWLYMYGEWPKSIIDHINRDKSDNRISNLRDVTASENAQNKIIAKSGSSSGILGVSRTQNIKKSLWEANITYKGKSIRLGRFDTKEEAHAAYLEAKRRLHPTCTI